jgi:predicted nuclease with TOPRIM domain
MGEKKLNIIGVTTFFLIIAIVVMRYYLYSSNSKILSLESKEAELNSTIENLKNTSSVKSETTTLESDSKDTSSEVKTSKMSFSELMDMIYVKNKAEIKRISYQLKSYK